MGCSCALNGSMELDTLQRGRMLLAHSATSAGVQLAHIGTSSLRCGPSTCVVLCITDIRFVGQYAVCRDQQGHMLVFM
jgi:hypothetical protein